MISKLLAIIGLLFLVLPSQAIAQKPKGIGIAPALQELSIGEGENSTSFELGISNTNDHPVSLRLSTIDFGTLDESGGIAFLGRPGQETTSYSLSKWLVLEKDALTLESGQSQTVKISVNNRDDLSPGGHYGAVVVSGANDDGSDKDLSVLPAASTLVLLKKLGGEITKLELDSENTNKSWLSLPSSVNLRFQNTGNVHVIPRGTVEIFSPKGSRIGRGVINQQSSFILPESFRQFKVEVPLQSQPWLPGKYRIVTSWRHSEAEDFTVSEENVWYIGKLVMWALILLSLIIVLYLYIRYRKRPPARGV